MTRRRSRHAGVALALALLAVGCSGGDSTSGESAAQTAAEATETAPAESPATTAETTSPPATTAETSPPPTTAEEAAGEASVAVPCGEVKPAQEPARLACALLSQASPKACTSLSFTFLTVEFGAAGEPGIRNCRERIKARFGGASNVTVALEEESDSGAALTVTRISAEGTLDAQRVRFVRQGGEWVIDSLSASDPVLTPEDAQSADEIAQITLSWYANLDEAVCNVMTDRMLQFGWEKKGEAGKEACRAGLREATPLEDVEPQTPAIAGKVAVLQVDYGPPDERLYDLLRFALTQEGWKIDRLVGSGAVDE